MARLGAAPLFAKVCPILGIAPENHGKPISLPYYRSRTAFHRLNASTAKVAESEIVNADDASSIRWAQLALQGPRSEMEDEIEIENSRLPGFTYAAVFDGHAGSSSVTYLKNELFNECVKALQGGILLQSEDSTTLETALSQAFVQVDKRLISCRLEEAETEKDSGSTATVMFLGKEKVVVANVGDSRLVLSRGGRAEDLTADHRPFGSGKAAISEVKRIREAGGWISNGRVCGSLSVSRAFGDIPLKTRRKEMLQEGLERGRWTSKFVSKLDITGDWLIATPDVNFADLGQDAEFIILASDGLWDSMKSSEAVNFVRDQLREHGNVQRACEALAAAALGRNGQDNISIIIADLGKVTRQEGFSEREDFAAGVKQVLITSGILLLSVYASQLAGSIP